MFAKNKQNIELFFCIIYLASINASINHESRSGITTEESNNHSLFNIPKLLEFNLQNMPKLFDIRKLPAEALENNTLQYKIGEKSNDMFLNITQLIKKYGFKCEVHEVKTDDGYILTMYRIPSNGPPIFLMHGLLGSADDWVTAGSDSGIAYLFARKGYDVWMGNARGNKHSRKHVTLLPFQPEFWNFSWEEIGLFDLPVMIDYVLKSTNNEQLYYVGHSQGTTSFFVMCSMKPEYNKKIKLMIALSAVAWMAHAESPILRLLSPINPELYALFKLIGVNEFLPDNFLIKTLETLLCGTGIGAELFCDNIVFLICGFDYNEVNVTNLPIFYEHIPSGAATKQLIHYAQGFESGAFRRFDYGIIDNFLHYKEIVPPDYPVEKITAPVAIFHSDGDWLASSTDVNILMNKLQNVVFYHRVPIANFNHLDYIWAINVKKLIFEQMINLIEKYPMKTTNIIE